MMYSNIGLSFRETVPLTLDIYLTFLVSDWTASYREVGTLQYSWSPKRYPAAAAVALLPGFIAWEEFIVGKVQHVTLPPFLWQPLVAENPSPKQRGGGDDILYFYLSSHVLLQYVYASTVRNFQMWPPTTYIYIFFWYFKIRY